MRMMKNKRYKDIFKLDYYLLPTPPKDIFYYLTDSQQHDLPYNISGDEFLLKYSGDRRVVDLLEIIYDKLIEEGYTEIQALEYTSQNIAQRLYDRFAEKWRRIHDAMFAQYNPIENYNSTEKRTGDDKTSLSSSSDVVTQTMAFDSSTFQDTSKVINNSNPTSNYSKIDYNSTITKNGNIGVTTSQQMIESEIDLRQLHDFIDTIYGDIGAYLLSNIY